MIATFKEKSHGGFYCSECRMSFGEPHETCPFCGSIVSNYEEILTDSIMKQFMENLKNESNIHGKTTN